MPPRQHPPLVFLGLLLTLCIWGSAADAIPHLSSGGFPLERSAHSLAEEAANTTDTNTTDAVNAAEREESLAEYKAKLEKVQDKKLDGLVVGLAISGVTLLLICAAISAEFWQRRQNNLPHTNKRDRDIENDPALSSEHQDEPSGAPSNPIATAFGEGGEKMGANNGGTASTTSASEHQAMLSEGKQSGSAERIGGGGGDGKSVSPKKHRKVTLNKVVTEHDG